MIKRILTIFATVAVGAAGTSLAQAQGYPQPPGPVYSAAAPSASPADYNRPDAMDGVPDYDAYVKHLREHHPEREVPSYKEFFRERQVARYKGTGGRCC